MTKRCVKDGLYRCVKDCVWQSGVNDGVSRWWVTKWCVKDGVWQSGVKDGVCVCVKDGAGKMVCDKVVCQRWCLTKWCVKDGV